MNQSKNNTAEACSTDYSYTPSGLQFPNTTTMATYVTKADPASVEAVIKALGTMILMPNYETDPNAIGKKVFTGNTQVPILQGAARDLAEEKLVELIKSL